MITIERSTTEVIREYGEKFVKAIETEDFIYFIDETEGDDNGNTLMFSVESLDLISYNYLANGSLINDIITNKATVICDWFKSDYATIQKEHIN
jgi:hypothetical protein